MNEEKEKYISIYEPDAVLGASYISKHGHGYGEGAWGSNIIDYLKKNKVNSLADIGCGQGKFVNLIAGFVPKIYGIDIASVCTNSVILNEKITYLDGEAKDIPLPDN